MRIGFDYRAALGTRTGIGRFTRELASALDALDGDHRLVLYAAIFRSFAERTRDVPRATEHLEPCVHRVPGKLLAMASRFVPITAERWTGPVDLFHLPSFTPPPLRTRRVLYTIHDVSFEIEPNWYPPRVVRYLRRQVARRLACGDEILTVSESSRRDILDVYGLDPERVHVARLGVDPDRFRPRNRDEIEPVLSRYGIDAPYWLDIAALQPRKNLATLLDAIEIAAGAGSARPLVVAGSEAWGCERERARLLDLERRGLVRHVGDVPDADLPALYAGCEVFCYPSFHEGFGLPVLEAMACGVPVVTSDAAALRETGGDVTCVVPANDPDAFADALTALSRDAERRRAMSQAGRERALDHSWESCARSVLDVYRRMLA